MVHNFGNRRVRRSFKPGEILPPAIQRGFAAFRLSIVDQIFPIDGDYLQANFRSGLPLQSNARRKFAVRKRPG